MIHYHGCVFGGEADYVPDHLISIDDGVDRKWDRVDCDLCQKQYNGGKSHDGVEKYEEEIYK